MQQSCWSVDTFSTVKRKNNEIICTNVYRNTIYVGMTQTSFSPTERASVNRLEVPFYHFETDHDTASKIAHKIFIIFNVLIQLTQCDVLMTLLN